MARQFKPKTEGVETVATETAIPTEKEETPVTEEVVPVVTDEPVQKQAQKLVRICPVTDHNCCIGGVRYFLRKGVQTNVPQEVKEILAKSNLLQPL